MSSATARRLHSGRLWLRHGAGQCRLAWPGFEAIGETYGEPLSLASIDTILITHGHIDHFGGLPFVRQFTEAPIGVHVLDRRVLSNHEERMVFASRRLEMFLEQAGVAAHHREALMSVYIFGKTYYRSTPVQFLLEEGRPTKENIAVYHVPGHSPGLVCLQVDDILLTADHVLARITPHQAPESITNHMGLSHYFASLDHITHVAQTSGVRLGLGGHEAPIDDIPARVAPFARPTMSVWARFSRVAASQNPSPTSVAICLAPSRAITSCWPWKKRERTSSISISAAN